MNAVAPIRPRPVVVFERATRRLSIAADKVTTLNTIAVAQLRNALVTAADKYRECAAEMRKAEAATEGAQAKSWKSMAEQFDRQVQQTQDLIALVDGADDAEADTAIMFVAEGMHG